MVESPSKMYRPEHTNFQSYVFSMLVCYRSNIGQFLTIVSLISLQFYTILTRRN